MIYGNSKLNWFIFKQLGENFWFNKVCNKSNLQISTDLITKSKHV